MRTILILLTTASLALLAGCESEGPDPGKLDVVATTSVVADLVAAVGGEATATTSLLPANADPHGFEPKPSTAEALADADLIVRSGAGLDDWLDELIAATGSDAPVLDLGSAVGADEGLDGKDPDSGRHWWLNPANASAAVEAIRTELVELEPANAAEMNRNADAYLSLLRKLDRAIDECVAELPAGDRRLVSSHDSLRPFADRYGFEVIGAAIPAASTEAQASAGETAKLVELIREQDVAAIFPEAGVSSGLERAIAEEAGAKVGDVLWVDGLGPADSEADTYVTAMATNALEIVAGLSRDGASCGKLAEMRDMARAGR